MGVAPEPDDQRLEAEEFCRRIEAYLCRKNDGHLIRIVGPAFDQVCGWARQGVPLGVAQRGIDRYFERYYAKGPRRRPVRVEFCEADVLDTFDEWKRATGVAGIGDQGSGIGDQGSGIRETTRERAHGTLPSHLDRVIARLTAARAGEERALDGALDDAVRELDGMRAGAKGLRGHAREACMLRLAAMDAELVSAARARCDEAALQQLQIDADEELAPFRARMLPDAYERSRAACIDRLLRERYRLPIVTFE